jgi:hypothetical protein
MTSHGTAALACLALALEVAACGRAEAEARADRLDNGWISLGGHLWGDPARGCYAAIVEVPGGASATELAAAITGAGIATHDVVAGDGTLALAFSRPPYDGRLRSELAKDGKLTARACFWNTREPATCEAMCKGWL